MLQPKCIKISPFQFLLFWVAMPGLIPLNSPFPLHLSLPFLRIHNTASIRILISHAHSSVSLLIPLIGNLVQDEPVCTRRQRLEAVDEYPLVLEYFSNSLKSQTFQNVGQKKGVKLFNSRVQRFLITYPIACKPKNHFET